MYMAISNIYTYVDIILHIVAIYVLLQACGLHNQAITCGQLLKDKFVCFTSFPNDVYSYIACNPT